MTSSRTVLAFSVLHPARILRGGWALRPAQIATLRRAWEAAQVLKEGGRVRLVEVAKAPEGSFLTPTLEDLNAWRSALLQRGEGVACDIECAGEYLRGIGFCGLTTLRPVWVPLRHQGGASWWTRPGELDAVLLWIDSILSDRSITKVFHNGYGFDVPYLRGLGFRVEGPIEDTMLMAHVHQPEMRKGLQWLATIHMGFPVWKDLVAEEEEGGEGK